MEHLNNRIEHKKYRFQYHYNSIWPAIYGLGFMLAAGINFAITHQIFTAFWHGLLSWSYIGYWIVGIIH